MFSFEIVMFLHLVGDFVAQTDWMARNKSKTDDTHHNARACLACQPQPAGTFRPVLVLHALPGTQRQPHEHVTVKKTGGQQQAEKKRRGGHDQ